MGAFSAGHFAKRQSRAFARAPPPLAGRREGGRIFRWRTAKKQDFLRGARKNILCANLTKKSRKIREIFLFQRGVFLQKTIAISAHL
jgi:hypothetical protein